MMIWGVANRLYCSQWRIRRDLGHRLYGVGHTSELLARIPTTLLVETLRKYGASVGEGVALKGPLWIDNAAGDESARGDFSNLRIGNNAYIGKGCFFDLPDRIVIDEGAVLSAGVKILTHADCGGRPMSKFYPREIGPVAIGRGAWIGVGATILHAVSIGEGALVGAGAVVLNDVPPYTKAFGIPAILKGRVGNDAAPIERIRA